MPELTVAEALAKLATLPNPTLDQLRALVAETSIAQTDLSAPTKATVLYSGPVAEHFFDTGPGNGKALSSGQLASEIARSDAGFKIVDNTHAAELIEDPIFRMAFQKAEGTDAILFSKDGGFWSNASDRFVKEAANGDFFLVAPKPAAFEGLSLDEGIFSTVELKALLEGDGVGRINGIELPALREIYQNIPDPDTALKEITDVLSVKSLGDLYDGLDLHTSPEGGVEFRIKGGVFEKIGLSGVGDLQTSGFVIADAISGADGIFSGQDFERIISKANVIKALGEAGKVAGPVGDLIELGVLTGTVVGLLNAGDRDGAARAAVAGLSSIGGGALAGGAAAVWAAPLLAGGPVGAVAYVIVVVGAGIIGSEAGEFLGEKLYDAYSAAFTYFDGTGVDPFTWIADGAGAYSNFQNLTLDGLKYAGRITRQLINGELDIVEFFTGSRGEPEVGQIIVTANRQTGDVTTSYSGDLGALISGSEVGAAFGKALLEFARASGEIPTSPGVFQTGGGSLPSSSRDVQSGIGRLPSASITTPIAKVNQDGTLTIGGVEARIIGTDGRNGFRVEVGNTGSLLDLVVIDGVTIPKLGRDFSGDLEVLTEFDDDGGIKKTSFKIAGNPLKVSFEDAGSAIGRQLGFRLAGGDVVLGIGTSALLQTVGMNLGEVLDAITFGEPKAIGWLTNTALADIPDELLTNLKLAGIGAISSFLTAELINALGVDGFAGELLNTGAGTAIGQIVSGIFAGDTIGSIFAGLDSVKSLALLGSAVGSFLGTKLASEVVTFDTIGGQIGSQVGSSLGVLAASELLKIGTVLGGPLGAVIGAFAGFIIGGLIGSVFGGTPRSGADVTWDENDGRFITANAYSRKGGSQEAAVALATTVAETFNAVLDAVGGRLANPQDVTTGNYGMRKSDFVYRPISTRDKRAITFRADSEQDGAFDAITGYGIFQGLSDPDFRIIGGSNYAKRAVYATIEIGGQTAENFDQSVLFGNLASAQSYETYLANSVVINAIVAAERDSVFAAETAINLVRAVELGLTKRHRADWFGGFTALLDASQISAAGVEFGFDYDPFSDNISRLISVGDSILSDAIDIAGQTNIEAGDGNDLIFLDQVATNIDGFEVAGGAGRIANSAGLKINGEAADGSAVGINVAATIDAGAGNDIVHASNLGDNVFGGAGDDTLYGGRLDDWLLGGDGDDVLNAGAADGSSLGGDGNYLNGGDGNDTLNGREGSDWLEGGDGTDTLTGGAGDDILVGGAGAGDQLAGGAGDDQYVVRRGDGADIIDETASSAPVVTGTGDAFTQRIAGIQLWKANPVAAGAIRPDWVGNWAGVQSDNVASGEDAIVFGYGIEIGDIHMQRSVTGGAPGSDLIIQVMETVGGAQTFSGTQITVRDWFTNPFKRVEWLKFTDGTEIRIGDITSFVVGGAGNDVLIGTSGNDFVFGGAGDDRLFLLAGDDIGNGGTGNDMVAGDEGRDLLIGGLGNDELIGGKGADALSGDDGTDDLYGGADNDILSGGRGDGDHVVGGAGNDIFKYSRGDGSDTFADEFVNSWFTVWTETGGWNAAGGFSYDPATGEVRGPGGAVLRLNVGTADQPDFQWLGRYDYDSVTGTLKVFAQPSNGSRLYTNSGSDRIEFAPGINIQDIILERSDNDLVLVISDESADLASTSSVSDRITIKEWYLAPGQIEKLVFAQTGIFDIEATARKLIAGTDANDGSMATPLQGTAVNDWITGGSGDDVIAGGTGDDILAGNSGFDTLKGEAGNDVLYGGTGNDVLDGGAGKDILIGGLGEDTASYASASAAVRADLSASSSNTGDAAGDEYDSIENLTGGSGADFLTGDDGDNVLTGGIGNDQLKGGFGDDTYVWNIGDGADTIEEGGALLEEAVTASGALAPGYTVSSWTQIGETDYYYYDDDYYFEEYEYSYFELEITGPDGAIAYYSDQYYEDILYGYPDAPPPVAYIQSGWLGGFARTNGQQVTRQVIDPTANSGNDTLEFGAGISLSDLSFTRSGDDLIIRHGGLATSQVTIKGHYSTSGAVEDIVFADGFSVALSSILVADSNAQRVGSSGDDLITGRFGTFADNLAGGDGNDVLSGYAGNDQLSGGDGDDVLEGGAGADILNGGANGDVGDTVRYVRSAAVTIDLASTGAQSGAEAQGDTLIGVENVVGSQTGADILRGTEGNNRFDGLDGNNQIWGRGGDDVIIAGKGADKLYGDAGDDNIDAGDGNDDVYGGVGNDILVGGGGNDRIWGQDGDDTILGGDGNDTVLDGGAGNDLVMGDAGDDTLTGGAGNDNLVGGTGNDLLQGGTGNDTYLFDSRSGNDTIVDADGANAIAFEGNISINQLWMVRVGNDLKISVIGGEASITVTNYFTPNVPSLMRSISTQTHTIYLGHAAPLIGTMTASGTNVPAAIPSSIAADLRNYWHEGHAAAPTGEPLGLFIHQNTASSPTATGAVDHDDNITDYSIGSAPVNGSVALDAVTGVFTYTPTASYLGSDRFTIIVTDADGQAVEVPVAVTVAPEGAIQNFPNQFAGNYSFDEFENVAIGTLIGAVAASDPDSAATALGQQSYSFLVNGTASAISADGRYAISATTGEIRTNAALDFDTGTPGANYTVIARDNAGADGYNQAETSVRIDIADVNEAHSLVNAARNVIEGDYSYDPFRGSPEVSFNLNDLMLTDPENGRGLIWTFSDGSNTNGFWELNRQTGILSVNSIIDYETVTVRYETEYEYDDDTGEEIEYTYAVKDLSLANQNLSVTASDGAFSATANFTATITDKNEGPQLSYSPRYIIRDDQKEGNFATLRGYDPETGVAASSYTITNIAATESFHTPGSSSDVDNTGNPSLTIGFTSGVLNFQVPGDGEWEGGIRYHPTRGGRWYYQLDYEVTVNMTDSSGNIGTDTFTVTFLKHGTSGVLPIMLDLDGDGIELVDHENSTVFFDMDLDGIADRTGWVSADDGMLVLDRNGNGIIDNSLEISFASDDAAAVTDLEGLRAWDTNQNGLIDAGDEAFAQFQVWRDINQNGISEEGELFSLADMGIRAINLTLNLTGEELVEDRNVLFATSQFFRTNGTIGIVGDVSLAFDPSRTQEGEASEPYDELSPQVSEPAPVADPGNSGEANASDDGAAATPEETPGIPDAQGAANDDEAVSGSPDATSDSDSVSGLAAPIVFDLDNDGEGLVSLAESRTRFDMNLDGFLDRTGWIEEGDAFLALDRNGNGVIDDISEISFVADKEGARTDLEGLAAFDTNEDGVFDGLDDRFVEFRLWRDSNSNGLTDAGELLSLAEGGFISITLVGTPTGQTPVEGENIVFNTSTYTLSSGETGTLLDAGLAFRAGDGLPDIDFQESKWSGKSKHWRQTANNGSVQITPRRVNGVLSADAGLIAPASTYAIGNRNIGTLSTILLDLDGDGLEARRSGKSKAWFDMNGDGVVDDTGWMSGGDGMLVIDRDGNGLINDTSEITFLPEKENATSAWDGLGELDENGDGRISAADTRFGELAVWVDSNQDGISQGDEIRSLTHLGIRDISLNQRSTSDSAKVGNNLALSTSTFTWSNGVTATIGNVALGFEVNPAVPPAAVPMSPGQLSTAMAGARLAEAMSVFGSDASGSITGTTGADKAGTMDWLSVSAA